jgi:hypothetical protein
MGSWNSTCAVSNLHIQSGQEVAVFMLLQTPGTPSDMCYNDSLYSFCPVPFYGVNDSYGGVEDCSGMGLDVVINAIKENLYEMEVGENKYHDIAVKKEGFNAEKLFEADHEGRLGLKRSEADFDYELRVIPHYKSQKKLSKSDALNLAKLEDNLAKGLNSFQRLTHVQIHMDIYNDILANFAISIDWKKSVKFADVAKTIPKLVNELQESAKSNTFYIVDVLFSDTLAGKFLAGDPHGKKSLLKSVAAIKQAVKAGKSTEDLCQFLEEILKGQWINYFMSNTRKIWVPQCGAGSQADDTKGYEVLIKSMSKILKAEKIERKKWDNE